MYKEDFVATGTFGGKKLEPLFITEADRDQYFSIKGQTINDIKTELSKILQAMPDRDVA